MTSREILCCLCVASLFLGPLHVEASNREEQPVQPVKKEEKAPEHAPENDEAPLDDDGFEDEDEWADDAAVEDEQLEDEPPQSEPEPADDEAVEEPADESAEWIDGAKSILDGLRVLLKKKSN